METINKKIRMADMVLITMILCSFVFTIAVGITSIFLFILSITGLFAGLGYFIFIMLSKRFKFRIEFKQPTNNQQGITHTKEEDTWHGE